MYLFNFIVKNSDIQKCLEHLSRDLEISISEQGIKITVFKMQGKGLKVVGDTGEYTISYATIPDFCRALCILIDKLNRKEKSFCVEEERKIKHCGIMADISRNAVFNVSTAKDIISRIARMGMNTFMLYMEDVYKVKEYPYFGYMRGAYTEDELREIDTYAKDFGVEVVPCIQTLAHLKSTLRWPYAKDIKDTPDIVLAEEEKTYDFIDKMVAAISRSLSSPRIHIGMDEAGELGMGAYLKKHGHVDRFDIMCSHLKKVSDIVKSYDKKPFMWSDMFFRIASEDGEYYDPDVVIPKEVIDKIPDGVGLAYWDYYNENTEFYEAMIKAHKNMNCEFSFFGGVWTWNGVGANYDKTFRTAKPAIEACRKYGVEEVYATLWRDDGAETSIYTSLLGLQLYSEYIYYDSVSDAHLKEMFYVCTGYDMDAFLMFDIDNPPEAENFKKTAVPTLSTVIMSKQLLYQDILQGLFDRQYQNVDMKKHYGQIINNLENAVIPHDLRELFDYHKKLVYVLYNKCDIGIRITKNYKENNCEALKNNIEELKTLKEHINALHDSFSVQWLKENKPFGLDRIDLRFGGLKERISRAIKRLESYSSGNIDKIEELEEERLPFSNLEFVHNNFYDTFISASI